MKITHLDWITITKIRLNFSPEAKCSISLCGDWLQYTSKYGKSTFIGVLFVNLNARVTCDKKFYPDIFF